jgi:hypothetical protein
MSVAAGVLKIVVEPGRCPAIDEDTGRCHSRATEIVQIKTLLSSTYLKVCPFHADTMEDDE